MLKFFKRTSGSVNGRTEGVEDDVPTSSTQDIETTSTIESAAFTTETVLEPPESSKRRKTHQGTFAAQMHASTGLELAPAETMNGRSASFCKTCGSVTLRNVTKRWESHAKNCSGLKSTPAPMSAQAQAFVVQCTIGGEKHLNKLCDAYVVAYWLYKYKLSFNLGPKLHEVFHFP
jgi:hypothetical protein